MDCRLIQPELVLYHFGTIESDARREVETHLVSCRECLAGYLALKRHLETEDEAGPRPSESARLRLRAAVEREVRTQIATPAWRRAASWSVAAAAAAAIAAFALQTAQPPRTPSAFEAGETIPVDSANPGAAGLAVL